MDDKTVEYKIADEWNLHVSPSDCLLNTPINISVHGKYPGTPFTLKATKTCNNIIFSSEASFILGENGTTNLSESVPFNGTYAEANSMGLLWSMRRVKYISGSTADTFYDLSPIKTTLTLEVNNVCVSEQTIIQHHLSEDIKMVPIKESGFIGTAFVPQNKTNFASIIFLDGSQRFQSIKEAALLASNGYCTLSVSYLKSHKHTPSLSHIPVETIGNAIEWLNTRDFIVNKKIGIVGKSRGSELALHAASIYHDIEAIISIAGSGISYHGLKDNLTMNLPPAWTYRGKPLPYAALYAPKLSGYALYKQLSQNKSVSFRDWYEELIADKKVLDLATIPVENIKGSLLFISGDDDLMWDSAKLSGISIQRLNRFKHPWPFKHDIYSRAGHRIELPHTYHNYNESPSPFLYGGNQYSDLKASHNAWNKLVLFLNEVL
ncbi:acyl-CoA thioesterase/BAAT N-terminal domain-containing protein [Lysinibacillus agricola]|uniref:Acyl-CoA thioesterase/BAAT N-terminal domain-containing protein n=1 Tax=Lysinibacillus agricola TaxID=2590012 RepID=A0ABX7AWR7_9BACI|nr:MULTISPECIES: acyl-CoA thioesterase/bile acid-CoA:amino acid N-acyltransferase family protein [Lysinibacillus]KOS64273.1 hypothetical protein AN161_03600 [Lysinibacillus sp. FJAT-14222]QQP14393.1 acyl-CoA thioesterase/BAAT N-terminal domain-containing protein [Lysinibacillus agricola]